MVKRRGVIVTAVSLLVSGSDALIGQAPERPDFLPEVRQYISVDAPVVALTNVTLIDGTGTAPKTGQTIVIRGNRIVWVGPAGSAAITGEVRVLDLAGHTVIPGLFGMHDHMFYTTPGNSGVQSNYSFPRLYLASGVTTIRTTGSFSPYAELTLQSGIEKGRVPGPRMHVTGPYLISTPDARLNELGMHLLADEAAARRVVKSWAEEGAEWIKVYTQISPEIFRAVVDEAHRHGMKVTGHLCSISFTEAVELGIDNIEHGFRTNSDYDPSKKPGECPATHFETLGALDMKDSRVARTIRTMVDRGVGMTTTAVNEQLVPNRPGPDARTLEVMAPWIGQQEIERRKQLDMPNPKGEIYPKMREIYPKSHEFELAFARAGGVLAAGVDPAFAAVAGFGNQRNLELLLEAGFTMPETVRILTANGARLLGVAKDLGTVEVGKIADLVVLNGNLATDPRAIYRTVTVFKDGIGYDSAKLIESVKGQVGIR